MITQAQADVATLATAILFVGLLVTVVLAYAICVLHTVAHEMQRIADALVSDDQTAETIRAAGAEKILNDLRQAPVEHGKPCTKP